MLFRSNYDDIVLGNIVKNSRCKLKKYWKYSEEYKINYINKFKNLNKDICILSHDTDLSLNFFKDQTFQIVCSDKILLHHFSNRFYELHRPQVIRDTALAIQSNGNFVDDYAENIFHWQSAHIFEKRIDIAKIYQADFIDYLYMLFPHMNYERGVKLYKKWYEREKKLFNI